MLFRKIIPVYCGNQKKYKCTVGGIQRGFVCYNRRQILQSRCLQWLSINVKYCSLPINSDECAASIFMAERFGGTYLANYTASRKSSRNINSHRRRSDIVNRYCTPVRVVSLVSNAVRRLTTRRRKTPLGSDVVIVRCGGSHSKATPSPSIK
jgi:hypothetical protein